MEDYAGMWRVYESEQFEDEVVFVGHEEILGGDLRCEGRCPM